MKTEFNGAGRQEREEIMNKYLIHAQKEIEYLNQKKIQLNNRLDELETIIDRHLMGWCMVAIIVLLTLMANIGT